VIDINDGRSVFNYVTRRHHHDHQQQQQQQHHSAVYELPVCQQQHVYDPFTDQCRLVFSLRLTDDHLMTTEDATSSVTLVNGSSTYTYHQYSLYAVKTGAERVTALLASVVSVIALVVVVVVYTLRPALRAHVHGQTVLALVLSLLLMNLLYMLAVPLVDVIGNPPAACFWLSVALHYVSLTSVCWLNALAISSLEREKCRSVACCSVYALTGAMPVVVSMLMLSVLRLDGYDGDPACWTLGLAQLTLHTMMLAIVLSVNCVLYVVAAVRRRCDCRSHSAGLVCISVVMTLVVISDAVLTVAAAVLPQSTSVIYLSLAMHAALGPLVCLTALMPFFSVFTNTFLAL